MFGAHNAALIGYTAGNSVSGYIPSSICTSPYLINMHVQYPRGPHCSCGALPHPTQPKALTCAREVGGWGRARRRDLIGNRFEGEVPDLRPCTSLQNVYFKHNMLTGDLRTIQLPPTIHELCATSRAGFQ